MSNNIAQSFLRATTSMSDSQNKNSGRVERIFITMLFALIALFLLVALLTGTNAYRSVNNARVDADDSRLGLSLIANSIRMNDETGAVGVAEGPEGLALVLTEHLKNGTFETRIYEYKGSIVEEYTRAEAPFAPERAREIVASERFDFSYKDSLLTVYTDQGSTSVSLRSVGGGA